MRSIQIFAAVRFEANAIAAALGIDCPAPGHVGHGKFADTPVYLQIIGIGATRLPSALPDSPGLVIMAGLAGALDPALQVGDVVVEGASAETCRRAGARMGHIHTAGRIVATPEQKAALFRQSGAAAVDMESDVVRKWAADRGFRFVAVRAISDRADQTLEPAVLDLVDEWGRARPLSIAMLLLKRPRLIPHLMRLGRDSKYAADQLGDSLRLLIEQFSTQATAADQPG